MAKAKSKAADVPVSMKPRVGGSVTVDRDGKEVKRTDPTVPLDSPEHPVAIAKKKAKDPKPAIPDNAGNDKEKGDG